MLFFRKVNTFYNKTAKNMDRKHIRYLMADVFFCYSFKDSKKGRAFMAEKWASEAQRIFARAIVLDGMSKSDAFRKAYPVHASHLSSAQRVAESANKKFRTAGVQRILKELKEQNAGIVSELIKEDPTRKTLLQDVAELIDIAKQNAYTEERDVYGNKVTVLNDKAANVLLKAIERAAKMIGADEPEKVQNDVIISFEGDFSEYDG